MFRPCPALMPCDACVSATLAFLMHVHKDFAHHCPFGLNLLQRYKNTEKIAKTTGSPTFHSDQRNAHQPVTAPSPNERVRTQEAKSRSPYTFSYLLLMCRSGLRSAFLSFRILTSDRWSSGFSRHESATIVASGESYSMACPSFECIASGLTDASSRARCFEGSGGYNKAEALWSPIR